MNRFNWKVNDILCYCHVVKIINNKTELFVENPKFIAGWLVICMPLLYIIDNDGLHRDDYDVIQGENDY